jgi:L-ascorbate metabolism protein UlaG (beta-lactamase superfamily)
MPSTWTGEEPPAVVVVHEHDDLYGVELAAVLVQGAQRLDDAADGPWRSPALKPTG